jgi:hypothetical protein
MLMRCLFFAAVGLALHAQQGPSVVSIPDMGTAGDGVVDDSFAIQKAIDDSPDSSILDFGSGKTYLIGRTLRLRPNRIYRGASAIVMSTGAVAGSPMLQLLYGQSQSVTLDGLTFDAREMGGILQISVGGSTEIGANGVSIRNCSLLHAGAHGQNPEAAIYTPAGVHASDITGNRFVGCITCIYLVNPDHVSIANNFFDGTRGGNAISIVTYRFSEPYGDGLEITGNSGRNLRRMAIELVGAESNTSLHDPLIADNTFSDWNQYLSNDSFGISVAVGSGARILRNTLSGHQQGYGIEVGASGSFVSENSIAGFYYGIVIQGQADVTLQLNSIYDSVEAGITFSNAGANLRAQVIQNKIVNAQKFGIGMAPNNYGGSVIQNNIIERAGGQFSDDAGQTFIGIKMDSGPASPVSVSGNQIVQTAVNPPSQFDFVGMAFFGGYPGSSYRNNTVESNSGSPLGTGMYFWFTPYSEGSRVSENRFINLLKVSNGFGSSRVHSNSVTHVSPTGPSFIEPPVRKGQ